MGKNKTAYVCQECGYKSVKWLGKCPSCGEWNTLVEEFEPQSFSLVKKEPSLVLPVTDWEKEEHERETTGFESLDNALGGGLVKGQVILIAGEPGIGKSTLLLQISDRVANGKKVLYVSGEESGTQIALRAKRLGINNENLLVYPEVNLEKILQTLEKEKPSLLVLDSVQTIFSERLESSAGSVSQVREVTYRITEFCKEKNVPAFIVGQITKEGSIAGPKVLEHIVDTVLQFEGERFNFYRIVKVIKNRFGSTGEIAVFKMTDKGLEEVPEPSAFFISEKANAPGSVVFPHTEGSKPVLLEVQALVIPALYTTPQRRTQGFDPNRLALILAVLEKEAKIFTRDQDVFVNVAGGMSVKEPAADLAVAMAVVSSKKEKEVPKDFVIFGEVGLSGEIRAVHFGDLRLKEAKRFGFKKALIPKSLEIEIDGMEIYPVSHIQEAIEVLF
ncbi:DNA repair protein RadA [Aquifex aeolicus]|uniref:DNA repair protein RadA n=1 Tax=Aquifex aeolicus (strain VF5) TaxID=224324 RepID=RADA_AQUAE|nr:DNA repair protein RadA [Aquifex aeolicus]O66827.1 RecName: Full=DNA repair protein RadA; AltName: Full=Branch migration protein RadA [Aquifex aeolicus VF5]AAC06790.1 ATP-dependent protease sms [Aquifex aeolicus VF5]